MPRQKRKPIFIEPPRIRFDFIRTQAELFRAKYVRPVNLIPVPMEEIIELKLKLKIILIKGLQEKVDIDSFLTNDLSSICVDDVIFTKMTAELAA